MRKSINSTEVYRHKNPIPHASIIKGLMISSAISGIDNKTGNYPKEKNTQIVGIILDFYCLKISQKNIILIFY